MSHDSPSVLTPTIVSGLPAGVKEAGQRVDFRPEQFDLAIQTKGYNVWWSRAALCPCRNNAKTDQPDIECTLCKGHGRFWFKPDLDLSKGDLDGYGVNAIRTNAADTAVLIRAIMTAATLDTQTYERFGEWFFGTVKVTTQAPNKLSYLDRLVMADSVMAWSQLINYDGGATIRVTGGYSNAGLRYPAVKVHLLRSIDTIYREDTDFSIDDAGQIVWTTAPAAGWLTLHYLIHPVFEVMDHVYVHRASLVAQKTTNTDPRAQHVELPVHSFAKLDFLMGSPLQTESA